MTATVTAADDPSPNLRPLSSSSSLPMSRSKYRGGSCRSARSSSTVAIAEKT
jgi:hypothetical protein